MDNKYCEYPIPMPKLKTKSEAKRISRDRMFMEIAHIVALRGTCDRAQVGAVLVDPNNNIVAIGYNGAPSGEPHCDEVGHIMYNGHCIRTVHAEENCINKIENMSEGKYTLYVTHYPCVKCQVTLYEKIKSNPGTKLLIVFDKIYGTPTAFSLLSGIHDVLQISKFID